MDPRFRDLIERLASPAQEQRDRARAALCASGTVAVPSLIEALTHHERDTRAGACLALAEVGDRRAADTLVALSREDPDLSVRQLALRALAGMAGPGLDPEVRACFMEHLGHPDMFSRALACRGLGRVGDGQALRAVREALDDAEEWVRSAAAEALAGAARPTAEEAPEGKPASAESAGALTVTDPAAPLLRDLQSLDPKVQRRAQALLFQLGPGVIPRITPLVLAGPVEARRAAVEVLALLGKGEALHPLGLLLQEEDLPGALRPAALHAVARVLGKDPAAIEPPLLHLLRRDLAADDAYSRAGAVAALVSAGPGPRGEALAWLLERREEPWVMLSACRALCRAATLARGDEDLTPALLDLLGRAEDLETQVCLLEALTSASTGDQALVGPVSYLLHSDALEVRRAASRILARDATAVDRPTLTALVDMLDEDPDGQLDLVKALGRLTPAGDPLPVPALGALLYSGDSQTGREVTRALAAIGGPEAVGALVEAANSRRGPVVAHAAQALAGLDPKGSVVAVRQPGGAWQAEERLWCACGAVLRWVSRDGREQLRCPECDGEYVQSAAGKLFRAGDVPFGACRCPGCRRKRPLVRRGHEQVLICPESGLVHVRPYDHPRQIRRLDELPLGACACCAEPQPLIRVDGRPVCYRTREVHRLGGGVPSLAGGDAGARDDLDAINRALLQGTLGLAESGIATGGRDEED